MQGDLVVSSLSPFLYGYNEEIFFPNCALIHCVIKLMSIKEVFKSLSGTERRLEATQEKSGESYSVEADWMGRLGPWDGLL